MNLTPVKRLVTLSASALLLIGCAGQQFDTIETPLSQYQVAQTKSLDNRQRADLIEALITADIAFQQADYQTATSHYLFAADLTHEPEIIERSVAAAKAAKDPLALEQAARMWLLAAPDNRKAQSFLLQSQLAQQNVASALQTAVKYTAELKSSVARYSFFDASIVTQDPRSAFNLLRELAERMPAEPAIPAAMSRLFMRIAANNQQPDNILTEALSHAQQALAIDTDFLPAIRLKSQILVQLERDAEARNFLREKHQQAPKSKPLHLMLGQLLYDLGDYQSSRAHFQQWLKNQPNDLESRFYLAASLYALSQYQQALPHFESLLTRDYRTDRVAFYCGDSAIKAGDREKAITCLKRVKGGQFYIHSKVFLARLYAGKGDLTNAFKQVVTDERLTDEDNIRLIDAEIGLLLKYKDRQEAKARLEMALADYPDSLKLTLKQIEVNQLLDKLKPLMQVLNEARSQFEQTTKLADFDLRAASLLHENGHHQAAIDWLNQALTDKPEDKDLLYTRAIYKEPLGLFAEMVAEFKHLHQLYPNDLNIQNALGYTLVDLGLELAFAEQLIESAYAGLPNNAAVIDSKGWLAFRQGRLPEAISYLQRAFKLSPSAEIAAHLGEALWAKQEQSKAKAIWNEGLKLDADSQVLKSTLKRLQVEL